MSQLQEIVSFSLVDIHFYNLQTYYERVESYKACTVYCVHRAGLYGGWGRWWSLHVCKQAIAMHVTLCMSIPNMQEASINVSSHC